MFGLDPDTISNIKEAFSKDPKIEKVLLYGSRAKGDHKNGSDIDITLLGKNLSLKTIYKLNEEIYQLYLPYTFDISIFTQINNNDLVEHILSVGKAFYTKNSAQLPKGWDVKKFDEVTSSSLIGIVRNSKEQSPEFSYRYFKMNNIRNDNGLNEDFFTFVNATDKEVRKYRLKENDFLLNTRNSHELVGKTCLFKSDYTEPTLFNNNILRVTFKEILIPQFVAYAFSTVAILEELEKMKSGTTSVVGIYYKSLKNLPIPLPPLPEQKRIVAILDKAFAAIAKAKANAEQNLKNAKELFESYLQGVFENKDEGWEEKRLGDLCKRVSVGHVGPTSDYYCDESVGIPFLRSQNVRSGRLDWKGVQYITKGFHEKLKKTQLLIGDVLFVRVGANRGDCCVIKDKITELNCANIVFARLKEGNVDFIDKYCQSQVGRNQLLGMSVGAAQGVINTKSVADLIIPYPPLKEQQTIVKKLDALSAETKKLEAIYQQKTEDLEELKKSVLQKAFNGELTVKEIAL